MPALVEERARCVGIRYRRPSVRHRLASLVRVAVVSVIAASALPSAGCHGRGPSAPGYALREGASLTDDDFPLAFAHYAFSRPGSPSRAEVSRALADHLLVRALRSFSEGREKSGLASLRIAASIVRANRVAPESISDAAANAFDLAAGGPSARGDEGASIGIYMFWSLVRPSDLRPKAHLDALAAWTSSPKDSPPSVLVSIAREALRRSDALAYAPTADGRNKADEAILKWMDQIVAFKDGERVRERYGDEVYSAVLGFRVSGLRLIADHLRDGDVAGAKSVAAAPQTEGFIPPSVRHALSEASSSPNEETYQQIIAALLPAMKVDLAEDSVSDAILGTALAGTGEFPRSAILAEIAARELLLSGSGDAAPALLTHALLGSRDDPRRPSAKDLGRALGITAAVIRDAADRNDYASARRTFIGAKMLLGTSDEVGSVSPSAAAVKTLMAIVEGEAGRPDDARKLYDDALRSEPIAMAFAGRARLDARDGKMVAARGWIATALASKEVENDDVLYSDVLSLAGDLARRGSAPALARGFYEKALRLLVQLRANSKGPSATEFGRRIAMILSRFADSAVKEEEAELRAESAAGADAKASVALTSLIDTRYLRALRGTDAVRAKAVFKRALDLGLPQDELVRAAIVSTAIARRAGATPDPSFARVLTAATTRDDATGRMARFATHALDGQQLVSQAENPHRALAARFMVAIVHWGEAGLPASKSELEAVARADVLGSMESELVLELLEPDRAVIPGGVDSKVVAGI
ncbi:MAG: hypothetical protein NVS3B20_00810 [Polyangiales bacterium]